MIYNRRMECTQEAGNEDVAFGKCFAVCKSNTGSNIVYGGGMLIIGLVCGYTSFISELKGPFRIFLFIVALLFFVGTYAFLSSLNTNICFYEYGVIEKKGSKAKCKIAYDDIQEIVLSQKRVVGRHHVSTVHYWGVKDRNDKVLMSLDPADYKNLHDNFVAVARRFDILKVN